MPTKTIYTQTKFLDEAFNPVPLPLRKYSIEENINTIPLCPICGNHTTFNKAYPSKGFNKFCRRTCRIKNRQNSVATKSYNKKLKDKDWLYQQRIILQKSKELIAKELGCSVTPVCVWLDKHDIPNIKYNESNPLVKLKLKDKDWLYHEHKILKKTVKQIAVELGYNCSGSLVSVWLNLHEIEANKCNSYERIISKSSGEEREVLEFVRSLTKHEVVSGNRSILGGREIDIYIPELNFGIEYNGLYTHSFKEKTYHLEKTTKCADKDIFLFHIFSHQWYEKQDICKSMIQNRMGLNKEKIFARKCEIKLVPTHEKNLFFEENHIQGKCRSTLKLGLYYNDELVSVMSFGKSRFNKKIEWELIRFATKKYTNVVGGFSKLLHYFEHYYNPDTLVSYADRTYSAGNIYMNNGFELNKINIPSYHYIDKNCTKVFHRYSFQKRFLKDKLENYDSSLTEWENMANNKWKRYWDCGTFTFIKTYKAYN